MRFGYQIPRYIVDSIDSRWHEDIIRFIDSGDASEEFLLFLDGNVPCQNVIEMAFTLVSQDIATTAKQLKESGAGDRIGYGESMNMTFARLFTHMLLALAALDEGQRDEILKVVEMSLPPQQQLALVNVVNGIGTRGLSLHLDDDYIA